MGVEEFRRAVSAAIGAARRAGLEYAIEKAPYCVAPAHVSEFTYERAFGIGGRTFDDAGACGLCVLRRWCYGLDECHVRVHGFQGIRPIATGEVEAPEFRTASELSAYAPRRFRLNPVSLSPRLLIDDDVAAALLRKIDEARNTQGALCVVPRGSDEGLAPPPQP